MMNHQIVLIVVVLVVWVFRVSSNYIGDMYGRFCDRLLWGLGLGGYGGIVRRNIWVRGRGAYCWCCQCTPGNTTKKP